MLLSHVSPQPGTDLSNVIQILEAQAQNLANLRGTQAYERLDAYQVWASTASSQLRFAFDLAQVETFIDTRRHDFLFDMYGGPMALLNHTITAEQEDRARTFADAINGLKQVQASCARLPQVLLVPDTNVYLHQEPPFQEVDWHAIADTDDDVRLLLPMAVMRELDNAKRTPGNKTVTFDTKELVRDRARRTSRHIRTTFADIDHVADVATGVTMELLLDPRGHKPVADPDSEIIDRALALQTAAGRSVRIITSDGNMQFGARVAGVGATLLDG